MICFILDLEDFFLELKLGNNKHGWRICSGVWSSVGWYLPHFTLSRKKKKITCLCMFFMTTLISQRSLNRCHGYLEQTVPFYILLMNFKATSVRKEDSGHGRQLPVGNPFGRQVMGVRKQVSIFLWCIANEEKTRLIADRFMLHVAVSREWFGSLRKVYWPKKSIHLVAKW